MAFVTVLKPGPESQYWISRNMEWVLLTRSCVTVGYNLIAVYFYVSTTSDRHAILRFAKYMIIMYIALAVSRGCQLSTNFLVSNIGKSLMLAHCQFPQGLVLLIVVQGYALWTYPKLFIS